LFIGYNAGIQLSMIVASFGIFPYARPILYQDNY